MINTKKDKLGRCSIIFFFTFKSFATACCHPFSIDKRLIVHEGAGCSKSRLGGCDVIHDFRQG